MLGALNLVDVCELHKIPNLLFSTGCVYTYDKPGQGPHTMGSGVGFKETDKHNFDGSYYSMSKGLLDELLTRTPYQYLLSLRVRLPVGDDFNPRSLITKLLQYERLVNIPNSITVLHNMLPISVQMMKDGRRGVYNFCQVNPISHGEFMRLYKELVDPTVEWSHFTEEEQNAVVKAPRSNCHLDVSKLKAEYPQLLTAEEAVREAFVELKKLVDAGKATIPQRKRQ